MVYDRINLPTHHYNMLGSTIACVNDSSTSKMNKDLRLILYLYCSDVKLAPCWANRHVVSLLRLRDPPARRKPLLYKPRIP